MITRYGYTTVGIITLICVIIMLVSIYIKNNYLSFPLVLIGISIFTFTLYFFRDPDRIPPPLENIIVSPADGEVIIIKELKNNKFIDEKCRQISIFMSPLSVHVNRIPISGKIEYLNYHEGEYLVAFHDKADERNERNEIGIESKYGKVFFTQVAGAMARRIVSELNQGQEVIIGERFGMIKFGSRADVIVPVKWNLKVRIGDKVTAGETILYDL
ncbi:MAG: phosphatidylserine decarboxylase [Ignavibacteria bacterium RBG_13_36_8]|nr:MAG: phosphatidylserine decarboxylase [Ignavibacteria bacterium RBG_13_36_8]